MKKPRKMTPDVIDEIRRMRADGKTFAEISELTGYSQECCRIHANGLEETIAIRHRERRAKEKEKAIKQKGLLRSRVKLPDDGDASEYVVCDKYCRGCMFYGKMSFLGKCCNYVLATGIVRVERPRECTRRLRGAPIRLDGFDAAITEKLAVKMDDR